MALSLGWHIILACFGVAFPAMIFVVHRRGIRRDDPIALTLARKLGQGLRGALRDRRGVGHRAQLRDGPAVARADGPFGDVLGLPFAFEGLSFFVEAIFLGIYLYGWDRMPPRRHLLMLVPMAVAGVVGTFCVVAVNAWMNVPTGFRRRRRRRSPTSTRGRRCSTPRCCCSSRTCGSRPTWSSGFVVAAVYAAGMLRGRRDDHHRLGFTVPFAFASVAAVIQPFIGHLLGMRVGRRRSRPSSRRSSSPPTTESPVAAAARRRPDRRQRALGPRHPRPGLVHRPRLASPSRCAGLDTIPADGPAAGQHHPPGVPDDGRHRDAAGAGRRRGYWLARWRGRDLLEQPLVPARSSAVAGPLAVIALEAGWIATEVGRQPWIV